MYNFPSKQSSLW